MLVHVWHMQMVICIGIVVGLAAAAQGQYLPPDIGSYYGYPYNYNPNSFYNSTVPRPPIGSYVPRQMAPPFPFYTVPPSGVLPQPYPYVYQPPLYQQYLSPMPQYPPGPVGPYYYGGPYIYPGPRSQLNRRYSPRARQWQNVAPVGSEIPPQADVATWDDTPVQPMTPEPAQP